MQERAEAVAAGPAEGPGFAAGPPDLAGVPPDLVGQVNYSAADLTRYAAGGWEMVAWVAEEGDENGG